MLVCVALDAGFESGLDAGFESGLAAGLAAGVECLAVDLVVEVAGSVCLILTAGTSLAAAAAELQVRHQALAQHRPLADQLLLMYLDSQEDSAGAVIR